MISGFPSLNTFKKVSLREDQRTGTPLQIKENESLDKILSQNESSYNSRSMSHNQSQNEMRSINVSPPIANQNSHIRFDGDAPLYFPKKLSPKKIRKRSKDLGATTASKDENLQEKQVSFTVKMKKPKIETPASRMSFERFSRSTANIPSYRNSPRKNMRISSRDENNETNLSKDGSLPPILVQNSRELFD